MSPVECAAWFAGTWLAIAIVAAWIKHRIQQRNRAARVQQQRDQRTPEDVLADAAAHRARRRAEQVADDLDTCRHLWPNPPTWRTAVTQYRHDTAKQRKEKGQ